MIGYLKSMKKVERSTKDGRKFFVYDFEVAVLKDEKQKTGEVWIRRGSWSEKLFQTLIVKEENIKNYIGRQVEISLKTEAYFNKDNELKYVEKIGFMKFI